MSESISGCTYRVQQCRRQKKVVPYMTVVQHCGGSSLRAVVLSCCNRITSGRSIRRAGYESCCLTTAIGKWFRISWPNKDCDLVIFDAGV
ncbi:hypothetical protein T01_12223 [Trichinella spiralis]|uniref:Uncharacterized protein n=1 Tax=Trichinella spiralis TaxID=6334 RepID=A0A0V1AVL5_TRISP|nr:hypothetical protein T01_12223 [Trichinella spiralis]